MVNGDRCVCCGEFIPEGLMVCPKCEKAVEKAEPNCEKCRYRFWLAHDYDVHVDMNNCDQYNTELCKVMNDPGFIKWIDEKNRSKDNAKDKE